MKTDLWLLYHVIEYAWARESQMASSRKNGSFTRNTLGDLAFLSDRLLAHHNDDRRELFLGHTKKAVLKLQAELRVRI